MSEEIEKKKPGPAPRFGERKACLTRLRLDLVARLQARIQLKNEQRAADEPECSLSEGIAILLEQRLDQLDARDRKEKGAVQKPKTQPAPVAVSVLVGPVPEEPAASAPVVVDPGVVSIARGSPPAKDSPWPEISRRLKTLMGDTDAWDIWISDLKAVAFEHCRLLLHCPNPFFVEQLQAKSLDDVIAGVAEELCGEPIKVLLEVDPEFEARQRREEEERATKEREAREKQEREQRERPEKIEQLKKLYLTKTPEVVSEAERVLLADESLWAAMQPFFATQLKQWISSATAGATYQQHKEAHGKWSKNRPRRS